MERRRESEKVRSYLGAKNCWKSFQVDRIGCCLQLLGYVLERIAVFKLGLGAEN